ncbi:hypothetical protein ma664 [Moumouvirus australiensis]|uniref:Uncharacterized protein n=1 Tax=Moumouvirus australiensis TaxID=2109587 RepID=A0A2P1EMF2_9VIRU|nr:hypothetical protein QKC55_gp241 [Moumouvirus australiensis]AVL95050.1 hypothetical protein ma664 [Moumouvirus australiensis]
MIRLNDKPDISGTVHFLTNLKHKHFVKFGGLQSNDSIDSFHKFMCEYGVWDPTDKIVKSKKQANYLPGPEYDNISVVLKFYNLGVIAYEDKMKMRIREQIEREQREHEYKERREIEQKEPLNSSIPNSQRESFENLHTADSSLQKSGIVLNIKGRVNNPDDKQIPVLQLTNPNITHDNITNITNNAQVDNINQLLVKTPRKSASFGLLSYDSDSLDDVDDLLNHEDFSDDPDGEQDGDSDDDSHDGDSDDESPDEVENNSDDSDNQVFIDLNIPDDNIIEFENKNKSDKNKSKKSKLNSNIIAENNKSKPDKQNIKSKNNDSKTSKKSTKKTIPESESEEFSDSDQSDDFSQSEPDISSDSDSNNSEEDISSDSDSSEDEVPKKKTNTKVQQTTKKPLQVTKSQSKTNVKKPVPNSGGSKTSKPTPKPAPKSTKKQVIEKTSKKSVIPKSPEVKKRKPGRPKK